ncbi:MAG: hypothetical protein ACJATA_001376 [Sphingobacteriales bacterium]|jgi:hypothetical protein
MRNVLIFILLGLFSLKTSGQTPTISAQSDTTSGLIGDPITVKFTLSGAENTSFDWPLISDTLGGLEILSQSGLDTANENNKISISKSYQVTAFDSGSYTVPIMVFQGISANGDSLVIASNPLNMRIDLMSIDSAGVERAIKPPVDIPLTFEEVAPYIIGGLLLLIALFLIYYFWKKRKNRLAGIVPEKPLIPAHIEAIEALKVLENQRLWENDKVKEHYSELTHILKQYLDRVFQIEISATTSELIQKMKTLPITSEQVSEVERALNWSDIVKFAKGIPLEEMHMQAIEVIRKVVHATKPKEGGES